MILEIEIIFYFISSTCVRILVASPGHLRTVPMGYYCAETFRSLGHETLLFDSGSLTLMEKLLLRPVAKIRKKNRLEKISLNRRLQNASAQFRPDLFLSIMGFDLFAETIAAIRKQGAMTACWWLNDPFQFDRGLSIAPAYQRFFSNCDRSTARYVEKGCRMAAYLPHAAFTPIHRPVNLSLEEKRKFESEVCFVGDWGPVRQGILSILSQKIDLKIWGPWRKHLSPKDRLWSRVVDGYFTPEDMAKIFSSTKLAINLHSWFGYYDYGLNPRTFEAPSHSVVEICDWKESLGQHFRNEEEIVTYRTGMELEDKIRKLLVDTPAREKIAEAGFKRVQLEHTYTHRMKELLSMLKMEK